MVSRNRKEGKVGSSCLIGRKMKKFGKEMVETAAQ